MRGNLAGSFAFVLVVVVAAWMGACVSAEACTVIAVGKDASADGSVIVSHANDAMRDFRIVRVPGGVHASGSLRPVYYDTPAMGYLAQYGGVPYLRYVGTARGPVYDTGQTPNIPLGAIPQVARTYAYFEGTYPIMNERQVSIGETTCQSKVTSLPEPGRRIFYSAELARGVLERCDNARDGVALIGRLIDAYGYYGTGEVLVVADKREAWVVEMCGYDKDGTDGLWVAKRIPDDEVFVSANQFRIREVEEHSSDMLYSANLFEVCQRLGWWDPAEGPLDWLRAVSSGELGHPYYSLRRVWRLFSLISPSAGYSPKVDDWDTTAYPFSVKPDHKLTVQDVMALHRDVYRGTSFDLTAGLAAGAFGDPTRFDVQSGVTIAGAFERAISSYRCNYIDVTQARDWLPDPIGGRIWVGLNEPDRNCFMPLHVGATKVATTLDHGDLVHLDLTCAWWVFRLVWDAVGRRYDVAIQDLRSLQERLESESFELAANAEQVALGQWRRGNRPGCATTLAQFDASRTRTIIDAWTGFWARLQVKYLANYAADDEGNLSKMGYPVDWLEGVGYAGGPVRY